MMAETRTKSFSIRTTDTRLRAIDYHCETLGITRTHFFEWAATDLLNQWARDALDLFADELTHRWGPDVEVTVGGGVVRAGDWTSDVPLESTLRTFLQPFQVRAVESPEVTDPVSGWRSVDVGVLLIPPTPNPRYLHYALVARLHLAPDAAKTAAATRASVLPAFAQLADETGKPVDLNVEPIPGMPQ